ncbi:MAG: hypothetical protein H7062_05930 [Candidatus Saccharimonas sp.]|nr:hypothetical protein [Planctomycetaceae bacterium]
MAGLKLVTKREWRLAVAFCAVLLFVGEPARTQEPARPADALSPSPPRDPAPGETKTAVPAVASGAARSDKRTPLDALPVSIRFLPNKLNELVPIPANATLEGYFEYVANLAAAKREEAPAATVSSIELTGDADDERATLNVRLVVRLRQPNEWVQVPLQLNQAVLTKPHKYTGDGQEIPDRKDPDRGHVWWFRGAGPHQLDLSMSVPIRRQLPSRRLQLSLPASPVAKLKLTVPHRAVTASAGDTLKAVEQTPLEITPLDGGKTQLEAFGLGRLIDLSWQPTPEASPTESSLEANTTILAQVDTDAVLLDVDQRVQALQGTFDSFAVQLPAGAEILKIEGEDYRDREHRPDPTKPTRAVVLLSKATSGPVRLRWTVRLPGAERKRLQLEGFAVEGARKQSGEIGLAPHDGLRLSSTQQRKDANVLRINAAELRAKPGSVQATQAYRFLTQPFHLSVGVEPIEAYYLVEPKLFLSAAVHQLSLDAALQYQVYRDSLSEVTILWPDWKAEGWIIDGLDPPDLVEAASLDEDRHSIRVKLVKRQAGAFQIRLRARRAIKGIEDVTFTLPRAKASSAPTVSLIVANAENVETELTARGETVLRPMLSTAPDQTTLPESLRGLKWTGYRLDTDEQSLALHISAQQRRLRTESSSEAVWQNDRVQVVQRIACDVAYERMSQLKLKVPRDLPTERVRFFAEHDVELTPEWTEEPDSPTRLVRLALPEPKIGRFEVQARFFVRVPGDASTDGDATLAIPIVQSGDEPFSQTRFSLARTDWFEAAAAEVWKPLPLRPEAWLWSIDGSQSEFELRMTRSRGSANGTASVSRGLVTAKIEQSGQGQLRAQFRIASRSSSLNMTLPTNAELSQVVWDRTPLAKGIDAVELPAGSRKYTLRLPDLKDDAIDHLLTIDYQMPCASDSGGTDSLELLSPQLPQSSWVAQVVWQVVLPADQHVFTYPTSATPMFRWRRQGLFWHRVSDPDPSQLRQWIGAGSGPPLLTAGEVDSPELAGNLYAFSQFGAPRALSFRVLSRPMVVLFGASLSLIAGFAMLRIPALRHVLTVLFAGLVLAAIGLWYSAPLELLLQPMIVGLLLPTVAVLIEGWFRRRYGGTILTLPTPAELSAAHASRQELLISPNGDDPTLLRIPIHDSRDIVRTESGSGVS